MKLIRRASSNVASRILKSIGDLAWYAAAGSIIAALIYWTKPDQFTAGQDLTLREVVMLYAADTIVSGVVLGLLRPLATGIMSTLLVSIPVAFPSGMIVMWLVEDRQLSRLTAMDVGFAICIATFVGPFIVGYLLARGYWQPPDGRQAR
jgi:hypothetical protein